MVPLKYFLFARTPFCIGGLLFADMGLSFFRDPPKKRERAREVLCPFKTNKKGFPPETKEDNKNTHMNQDHL